MTTVQNNELSIEIKAIVDLFVKKIQKNTWSFDGDWDFVRKHEKLFHTYFNIIYEGGEIEYLKIKISKLNNKQREKFVSFIIGKLMVFNPADYLYKAKTDFVNLMKTKWAE